MPTAMSAKQIAQVAYNAGWRGEDLVIATAVALAESSGQYWVVNSIGCVGLWQINVPVHKNWTTADMKDPAKNAAAAMTLYKGAGNKWTPWEAYTGPDGKGSDGPYTAQMGRARMAAAQIKGAGNVAVPASDSTTTTGPGGVNPASFETISGTQTGVGGDLLSGDLIGTLQDLFGAAGGAVDSAATLGKAALSISVLAVRGAAWLADPKNWLRVVEVLGGGVALIIGLKMLADTGTGGAVGAPVGSAVKGATKAVKAVRKATSTTAKTAAAGAAA